MLERLKDLPRGVDGVRAVGKVTRQDYEDVLEPMLDEARREGRRVRFLYQFGPEFEGFTPGAMWEDARVGLRSLRLFEALACVSDVGWIRESVRFTAFFLPCATRVFGDAERG
ncbi:MAG: STAS/SEC14 domain-containing protein, partial [Polyangiaceae bacterium]